MVNVFIANTDLEIVKLRITQQHVIASSFYFGLLHWKKKCQQEN